MKPLSEGQANLARKLLIEGPLRPVAKPSYRALLALEERWFRIMAGPPRSLPPGKVTAVIKTFERPRRCMALIESVHRHFPGLPIIVVDDSREPGNYPNCLTIRLPFDSGLSAGRNAGLAEVQTKYFLTLDDDFLFDRQTDLAAALSILDEHREIDLLSGEVVDLPLFIKHDSRGSRLFPTDAAPKISEGTRIGPAEVMEKVPNFFVARTDAVRPIGWDPELKLLEHADFFTRARGRIVSARWGGWRILHCRDPFDRTYREFRDNLAASQARLRQKYGLKTPGSA